MSDPAEHTDGLAALQARRNPRSRKRELPKSQNPTTLPPYRAPEVIELDAPAPAGQSDQPATTGQSRPVASVPVPAPSAKAPSRKIGLYLEEPHEDFMEAVRVAGNALRPKVNLSGSAVVRLAMDRLMDELSANEVRDALVAKPVDPAVAGRPRR